jgi:hypothetical protein
MKTESLKSAKIILLVNWAAIPTLFIWIVIKVSFMSSIIFLVLWLVIDKIWDWVSGLVIEVTGKVGASEKEALEMQLEGYLPARMAIMMIIDLIGALAIPWIIAGFYLLWF